MEENKVYLVDLNSDLGEGFGRYSLGQDQEILHHISSANIACGFHASDPDVMARTVALALASGVRIGAHPGFPDLVGFGRRDMKVTLTEARNMVTYQLGALEAFLRKIGSRLQHVKPHGALYNMAGKDPDLASAICEAVLEYDPQLILMGLSGSELCRAAQRLGLATAQEFFSDRAYEEDGSLVSRAKAGAMILDEAEAIQRVVRAVREQKVTAITGADIPIIADTVCIHGDGARALEFAVNIRKALNDQSIKVAALQEVLAAKGQPVNG